MDQLERYNPHEDPNVYIDLDLEELEPEPKPGLLSLAGDYTIWGLSIVYMWYAFVKPVLGLFQ